MTTDRQIRQAPLNLHLPASVALIGIGGVGSWAAYFLALAGVPALDLWDSDIISDHNLNRFPVGRVGQPKVEAMAELLLRVAPSCIVGHYQSAWTPPRTTPSVLPEWLLVSTDTHASRLSAYTWATEHKVKYIEASAEGEFGGVTGAPATFTTDLEDNPGYASVPVHVGPCVLAASFATYHILHDHDLGQGSWRIGFTPTVGIEVQRFSPTTIAA